jgi:hypothetical protein
MRRRLREQWVLRGECQAREAYRGRSERGMFKTKHSRMDNGQSHQ